MGVRPTILPWLVLAAGLAGCAAATALQWYCNSPQTASPTAGLLAGYPLVFSGKPYWSLPANIPIIFELTVLLSALMAFFGVWGLSRLPQPYFPAFKQPAIPPRHRRRLLHHHRGPRSGLSYRTGAATAGSTTNSTAVEEVRE